MQTANSERGVLLALAALEEYPYTPQAEAALGHAVQESLPYKNMIDEEGQNLDGHWVDWSPDGKKIALGSATNHKGEHGAVVFDVESGEVVLVLPWVIQIEEDPKTNNKCSVQQINWSPDGTRLALVANNNNQENLQPWCYSFQIYDASSGELLLDLDTQGEFAVDWSPDGGQLLTGGEDGQVKIWDAKTGDLILELEGHDKTDFEIYTDTSDRVVAARFSPNGDYAATFSVGGVAHIWDIANGKVMQTLEHPPEIIARNLTYPGMNKIGLTWSPDGRYLATAWYDGLGRVWDIETGNVVQILAGHTGNMIGIDWSPDGVYLLTQGIDTSARLWVASTGQMLLKLPARGYGNAAWSTDGQKVATPTPEGLLTWDTFTLPPVISTSAPLQSIGGGIAHWSLDGNLFVLGNSTEQVFSWSDLQSSWSIAPIDGFFEISPDSSRVVAANGHNFQTAQVIDLYTGEVLAELKSSPPEPGGMYFTSSWSKDGTRVASGTYPVYWTVIWDPETGEELARSEIVDGFMMQAQFSPDGRVVASPAVFTEGNSPVYLIDTETGETLRELPSEDGWSCVAMWSPDGKILAVGYRNGVIKLWDTETWLEKETFQLHQSSVWDLNWSPNGQRIISGDVDTSVIVIWDVESGAIIAKWDMGGLLEGGFNDVDWSPDGQFVLMHGTGGYPFIKRAWQSTEDLIDYAYECCVWRELSAEERVQFGLPEKPSD